MATPLYYAQKHFCLQTRALANYFPLHYFIFDFFSFISMAVYLSPDKRYFFFSLICLTFSILAKCSPFFWLALISSKWNSPLGECDQLQVPSIACNMYQCCSIWPQRHVRHLPMKCHFFFATSPALFVNGQQGVKTTKLCFKWKSVCCKVLCFNHSNSSLLLFTKLLNFSF